METSYGGFCDLVICHHGTGIGGVKPDEKKVKVTAV
jgi:hypothetical protein